MPSRSLITNITPLPAGVSREAALAQLHDHDGMIKLNPLVIRHEITTPPPNASQDEAENATWYEIADSISYLGLFKGEVVYKACFYNLPRGIQTHVFAPAGVDIRSKWSVCGNAPGEPREPVELGSNAPRDGLYVKEELDLRCNFLIAGFVKKNLKSSHAVVVDKILEKAGHVPGNSLERNDSQSVHGSTHSQMPQSLEDPRRNTMPVVSRLQCACSKSPPHDFTCIYSDDANRPGSQPLESRLQAARSPSDSTSSRLQPASQNPAVAELYGSPSRDGCMCTGGLHDAACQSSGLRVPPVSPLIMPDVVAPDDRPVDTVPSSRPNHSSVDTGTGL